jgi:hypothetical protein
MPDPDVARLLSRALQSVTQKRCKLSIANPFDPRKWNRS